MSQSFALVCVQRADQFENAELTERAFGVFNRWQLLSTNKQVSLDEVAWVGALLVKAFKASGVDIIKHETRDANGSRVFGVVASDGVKVADGAG